MAMKKFEILNKICNNCKLTSKEKLVAYYFVYRSNQNGICYPSVNTIANHCGVSERTIQRATKKLQERGYLNINKRDINGKQTSNTYKLILEDDNKQQEPEATLSTEAVNTTNAIKMKVVALEDILMVNGNQELQIHEVQSTDHPDSTSIADKDSYDMLIERVEEIPRVKELKVGTVRNYITSCNAKKDSGVAVRALKLIEILVAATNWVNNRIAYLYIATCDSSRVEHILIIVKIENGLRLHKNKRDIYNRSNFMPLLGVPP